MSSRSSSGRGVGFMQVVTALMSFVVLSVVAGALVAGVLLPAAAVAGLATRESIRMFNDLPVELSQTVSGLPEQSNIYSSDHTLLATFFTQNRVVVPLEEISPYLQMAVVDIEDRRFWEHNGVDGQGLLRAIFRNASDGKTQGASTLTQQLVKNSLINAAQSRHDDEAIAAATEVSATRKLREAKLALRLEEVYRDELGDICDPNDPAVDCGKDRILEGYLNIAQFGRSVYGVETASELYFGKHAAELNALEAATLAGITQNPFKYDPTVLPENTQVRRDLVLGAMLDMKDISQAEYDEYVALDVVDTLTITKPKFSCVASVDAPFFCDYVIKVLYLDPFFGDQAEELLYQGVDIVTTLDLRMQQIANEVLRAAVPPTDASGVANALVALDPSNGHILVMAQNREFDPTATGDPGSTAINYSVNQDYGGSRGFSAGSTFKVVILAEWLAEGHSLDEMVSGKVREWKPESWKAACQGPAPFAGQKSWKPNNAGEGEDIQQTVLSATRFSVNTAYASMINKLDLCKVAEMAATLGFVRADGKPFETVPSMVLGTQNASPLAMATVTATFANNGVRCTPRAIQSITKRDGTVVPVPPDDCVQAIDERIARGVAYAMEQVINSGNATDMRLAGGRPAAGKTGTAQNNTHTWFIGFTPQLAAATWLGSPDTDVSMQKFTINGVWRKRVFGASISGPIWKQFMDRALEGAPVLGLPNSPPSGIDTFQMTVPDVRGMLEDDAQNAINDAGYRYEPNSIQVFSDTLPPGTVIYQSVEPGLNLGAGTVIGYTLSRNSLPDWWFTWPGSWDPCIAPADWWGTEWPPDAWGPATGWSDATCGPPPPPDPSPSVTPSP